MSSKSNNQGRSYEFAFIQILEKDLKDNRQIEVNKNSSYFACEKAWLSLTEEQHQDYFKSAGAGIKIKQLEPVLMDKKQANLSAQLQTDQVGIIGDVRDVIISCKDIQWEIGVSLKHNHKAVKHSRLSPKIDFGQSWYGIPCSEKYWQSVMPIFDRLKTLKEQQIKWREIDNKEENIYLPLLNAFLNNIQQAYLEHGEIIPQKMVEYLLGHFDFYKVISIDKKRLTIVQPFNLRGTLNQPSHQLKSEIKLPISLLPTEIIAIKLRKNSLTTVDLYLDAGWSLSFRLHNASTKVEPSLKFDIQFLGLPESIKEFVGDWEK